MLELILVLVFLAVAALAAAVIWLITILVRRIETLDLQLEDAHNLDVQRRIDISRLKLANYALHGDLADAHTCLELVLTQKEPA